MPSRRMRHMRLLLLVLSFLSLCDSSVPSNFTPPALVSSHRRSLRTDASIECERNLSACLTELQEKDETCDTDIEPGPGLGRNLFAAFFQSFIPSNCTNELRQCEDDVDQFECIPMASPPTMAPPAGPTDTPMAQPNAPLQVSTPTKAPTNPLQYTGSGCNVNGPDPSTGNVVMAFAAFGDSPYDEEVGSPFEGPEYECLQTTILPGIKSLANIADFALHVGDIKKGGSSYAAFCNDDVFGSRSALFGSLEPTIDFFIVVGDNEWNECNGYNSMANETDAIKTLWRKYFTLDKFATFDRTIVPSGQAPSFVRHSKYPENFFIHYETAKIAFFGITEPYDETHYDNINRRWLTKKMSEIEAPRAIVIFGHSSLSSTVLDVLVDQYSNIPTLHVRGEEHLYCMQFLETGRHPKLLEVTVTRALPSMVSIIEDPANGEYMFHSESTGGGCFDPLGRH